MIVINHCFIFLSNSLDLYWYVRGNIEHFSKHPAAFNIKFPNHGSTTKKSFDWCCRQYHEDVVSDFEYK